MDTTIPPPPRFRNHTHHCRRRNLPPRLRRRMRLPQPSLPYYSPPQIATTHVNIDAAEAEFPVQITQVWASNLTEEFVKIQWALNNGYGVVALDTEFPGTPYLPDGVSSDYRNRTNDDHYSVLKLNVERTKIIQVGITLSDEFGNLPHFGSGNRVVWEFNFSDFDEDEDACDKNSIAMLKKNGINFEEHKKFGIRSESFARLMIWSGLVGRSRAWITFQGGVDLAYLLKMIMKNGVLPNDRIHFNKCITLFFGANVFDVKHMMTKCELYGGLEKVSETLKVYREAGQSHQASSDSLLTTKVFLRIWELYFQHSQTMCSFAGKLHNYV